MHTLSRHTSPPSEAVSSQIQQMVIDYLTDISMVAIAPSNPLYNLYQYGVGYEAHLYLQAMSGANDVSVELIVAADADDPSRVVGFTLYLLVKDDPAACAVAYMAVQKSHRRQGVARAMLQEMLSHYPHAELACFAAKVPYFEAMGFQVLASRGPQVLMNTRDRGTEGLLAVLDIAPIYNSVEVRQIHAYLLHQHGKKAMINAENQRDRHLDQLARHAQALVRERLGEPDTTPKLRLV